MRVITVSEFGAEVAMGNDVVALDWASLMRSRRNGLLAEAMALVPNMAVAFAWGIAGEFQS